MRARVIARIARGEMNICLASSKWRPFFLSFDLAYLLTGYFTGIKPPQRRLRP